MRFERCAGHHRSETAPCADTFSGGSGALLRLNLFACNGASAGYSSGQGQIKKAPKHDFSAAIVDASKEAMVPALDQLFPSTKT